MGGGFLEKLLWNGKEFSCEVGEECSEKRAVQKPRGTRLEYTDRGEGGNAPPKAQLKLTPGGHVKICFFFCGKRFIEIIHIP